MKTEFYCKACNYEFKSENEKTVHGDKSPIEIGEVSISTFHSTLGMSTNLLACPVCFTVKAEIEKG